MGDKTRSDGKFRAAYTLGSNATAIRRIYIEGRRIDQVAAKRERRTNRMRIVSGSSDSAAAVVIA